VIAIVVVAYSRPYETRRLINSIVASYFDGDSVDLIVSIDKSNCQQEVYDACNGVEWTHGKYSVIMQEQRLGLRPHILKCGELTEKYDGVIVLEDDLFVSPNFYRFAKNALIYYGNDERVAQISLYSYGVNEFVSRPFYPEKNEYDVYAMQVTQSWGECWSRTMWENFMASEYYTCATVKKRVDLPDNVNKWRDNSWKKNFTNYIADTGRFVIYPYYSYTTDYTIAGEHCKADVPDYHVPMQGGNKMDFALCPLDFCVKYDLFFERMDISPKLLNCESKNVCIDLFGLKKDYGDAEVLISTARLPYAVLGQYSLARKPQEDNLLFPETGVGIFAYDLHKKTKNLPNNNLKQVNRFDIGCISWRKTLEHGLGGAWQAFRKRIGGKKK